MIRMMLSDNAEISRRRFDRETGSSETSVTTTVGATASVRSRLCDGLETSNWIVVRAIVQKFRSLSLFLSVHLSVFLHNNRLQQQSLSICKQNLSSIDTLMSNTRVRIYL